MQVENALSLASLGRSVLFFHCVVFVIVVNAAYDAQCRSTRPFGSGRMDILPWKSVGLREFVVNRPPDL